MMKTNRDRWLDARRVLTIPLMLALSVMAMCPQSVAQHHEHGRAELRVVQNDQSWVFEFESPALDLLNRETCFKPDEVKNKIKTLSTHWRPAYEFEKKSGCVLQDVQVTSPLLIATCEKETGKGSHHANIQITHQYLCKKADTPKTILLKHFSVAPQIKKIEYQILAGHLVKSGELTSKKNLIEVKP